MNPNLESDELRETRDGIRIEKKRCENCGWWNGTRMQCLNEKWKAARELEEWESNEKNKKYWPKGRDLTGGIYARWTTAESGCPFHTQLKDMPGCEGRFSDKNLKKNALRKTLRRKKQDV